MTAEPVLQALQAAASPRTRDEMGPRYGIVADKAMGVPMAAMQAHRQAAGPDHALAAGALGRPAGTRPGWSPA